MQIKYVNKALQRFDSTQVIPVQFVMFTLSVIIGSAVLYRDFQKATAESMEKFVGGCLLTFFGVFLITSGRPRADDSDEEGDLASLEEEDEEISLAESDTPDEDIHDETLKNGSMNEAPFNGDSANDDVTPSSRHSSQISNVDPMSRPRASPKYSNSSNQPSVQVVSSGLQQEDVDVSIFNNPWQAPDSDLLPTPQHPGIQSMTSTPLLPSQASQPPTLLTPARPPTTRALTHQNPHTHPNHQLAETTPPQADRPFTPVRHSISRMLPLPGPFLSPISGGLSAAFSDSLRRADFSTRGGGGGGSPRGLRRSRSVSQSVSQSARLLDDDGLANELWDDGPSGS